MKTLNQHSASDSSDEVVLGRTARVVDFDNIHTHGSDFFVPFDYKELTWSLYWGAMDVAKARPDDTTSGFHNGVTSGDEIAYIRNGGTASISARSFDVESVQMTASFDSKLNVDVVAYSHGQKVFDQVFAITDAHPTLLTLDLTGIDNLYFIPGKGVHDDRQTETGSQIIIDDLAVSHIKGIYSSDEPAAPAPEAHGTFAWSHASAHPVDLAHPVHVIA